MNMQRPSFTRIFLAILAACVLIWIAAGAASYYALDDWPARGQLGDLFGSVNALFSAMAFAGIVAALVLQASELGLQRDQLNEFREQRSEDRLRWRAEREFELAVQQLRTIGGLIELDRTRLSRLEALSEHDRDSKAENQLRLRLSRLEKRLETVLSKLDETGDQ